MCVCVLQSSELFPGATQRLYLHISNVICDVGSNLHLYVFNISQQRVMPLYGKSKVNYGGASWFGMISL